MSRIKKISIFDKQAGCYFVYEVGVNCTEIFFSPSEHEGDREFWFIKADGGDIREYNVETVYYFK